MGKTGVSITKMNKKVKELIPEAYQSIALNFLTKLKGIDKNLYKLETDIKALESLVFEVINGKQKYQKKHPLVEAHESQVKLYNATVREMMNYITSAQTMETRINVDKPPDVYEEEMKQFDADFKG